MLEEDVVFVGKPILICDFSEGIGHSPRVKNPRGGWNRLEAVFLPEGRTQDVIGISVIAAFDSSPDSAQREVDFSANCIISLGSMISPTLRKMNLVTSTIKGINSQMLTIERHLSPSVDIDQSSPRIHDEYTASGVTGAINRLASAGYLPEEANEFARWYIERVTREFLLSPIDKQKRMLSSERNSMPGITAPPPGGGGEPKIAEIFPMP